jgi:serine/threonine protein kinase
MWKRESYSLPFPGIPPSFHLESIPNLPLENLPVYDKDTYSLRLPSGTVVTKFSKDTSLAHGSYGNLYLTYKQQQQQPVLLKQPRLSEMNLFQEGILQSIAQKTLEKEGLGQSIPKIYDIFWRDQKVWFSMEYIPGLSVLDWFQKSQQVELDFFLLLSQICLCLACMEIQLGLDHRDLKIDNLLIKQEPCDIHVTLRDSKWSLRSPFTVVILDFGFACLGSKELRGKPIVNLGDGILPPMDPCPKEGRDLFQLLTSFLRLPQFTQRFSPSLLKRLDEWLSVGTKSYGPMARRWSTENWTYLVASQRDFAISSCCPINILNNLLPDLKGYLTKQ